MDMFSPSVLNDLVAFVAGIVLNMLLFCIVHRHTPDPMRSYSRMIRIHCLSDCLYGLINFVAAVQVTPLKGTVFLVISGICSHVNPSLASYLLRAYFWSIMFPIALIPIDFYYRYRSVCCNKPLLKKHLFGLVFIAYSVTFVEAFYHANMYIMIGPTKNTQKYTDILRQGAPKWAVGETPSYSVYEPNDLLAILSVIFVIVMVLFVYVVVIYTSWHIKEKVREDCRVGSSKRVRSTHHQVAKILFVQAAIPLTLCVPTTINSMAALLQIDLPNFGVYALAMSVWLAVLKPLATIVVVPNYRRAFLCGKRKNVTSSVSNYTVPQNNVSVVNQ